MSPGAAPPREGRRGLLVNITGDGKGKTTGAIGTAVRALGRGLRVKFLQFIKSDRETGEKHFFAEVPGIEFSQAGLGFTVTPGDHAAAARAGWREAAAALESDRWDLVVLDELNIALKLGYLDTAEVIRALQSRPRDLHVIVTGRNAPAALLEASDLVSEIAEVKHPYRSGVPAQPGIEF